MKTRSPSTAPTARSTSHRSPKGSINIFNADGSPAGQLTESSAGAFGEPCGVAVDSTGHVYVADATGTIDKFGNPPVDGTTEEEIPFSSEEPCPIAAGSGPSAGYVFVAGYTHGVYKVNSSEEEEVISGEAAPSASIRPPATSTWPRDRLPDFTDQGVQRLRHPGRRSLEHSPPLGVGLAVDLGDRDYVAESLRRSSHQPRPEVFGPIAGHHFKETFGSAQQPNSESPSGSR